MAISHQYTMLCDDVRVESNGKLILIGVYVPDIVIMQLPVLLPCLNFIQFLKVDDTGQFPFRARVQHLESGHDLAQAMGTLTVNRPGLVVNALRFGNLQVDRAGTFTFIVTFDAQTDEIMHSFDVVLHAAQLH
jgi:uncharacterized protein DUF6941